MLTFSSPGGLIWAQGAEEGFLKADAEVPMDFALENIKTAFEIQVISGMFFDRRVFLVANTGDGRPTVLALMPHQARAVAKDLNDGVGEGEVHGRTLAPRVIALPSRRERGLLQGDEGAPDRSSGPDR